MKKNFKSGFTLIELLVVIAIIGILASVVLASLNTARAKGADAKVKSELANMRAQAEIYYDTNGGYTQDTVDGVVDGACDADSSIFTESVFAKAIADITATTGSPACALGGSGSKASAWAMVAPLKSVADTYWCVDSTGASEASGGTLNGASCS